MTRRAVGVCTIAVLLSAGSVHGADLAAAKALYAAASYEDALTMLASLEESENLEQLNQIRALCLLALGRTHDAELAVEQIVLHNPAYELENADVSPKLVTLFHEVRRRTLPTAARTMYAKARSNYEGRHWADAQRDFSTLLRLIADPDIADESASLADLRQLADGFLKLSETELAAEEKKGAEAAAAAAAAAAPPASPATSAPAAASGTAASVSAASPRTPAREDPAEPAVFSALDRDVSPPVEQRRTMPRWSPANRALTRTSYSGLLEIVIDEGGLVASAALVKSVTPLYDAALKEATRTWRYTPARRNGKPVRYRQVLEIVLRAAPQE